MRATAQSDARVCRRPGAARLLLGRMTVDEVRGAQVPLEAVAGGLGPLTDQLAGAGSPEAAAEVLDGFAAELTPRHEPDAAVEEAVRMLRPDGTPHVPDLAEAVGLSERQLRRRFTEAVGYGPKTLHGILRFQRALRLGRSEAAGGPAAIAYEAGYADQAHFTREVRRLAGMTPSELLATGSAG